MVHIAVVGVKNEDLCIYMFIFLYFIFLKEGSYQYAGHGRCQRDCMLW